jgi:plastocyanin
MDFVRLVMLGVSLLPLIATVNFAYAVVGGPYTNEVSVELGSADANSGKGFSPQEIIISIGTTVVWTNDDTAGHTVTSGNPGDTDFGSLFDSGFPLIAPGNTFEYTFDSVGEFPYFCQVHPWATGMVTVAEVVIMGEPGMNEGNVSVQYEDNSFDVPALLSNGTVEGIDVDRDFSSIIITVDTDPTKDGELSIGLPRELIDAKANGSDDTFIILVDGEEVDYEEIRTTDSERELVIPIFAGSGEIEIVGTNVIPEFPLGLVLITASIVSLTVGISRIKKMHY